VFVLRRALAQSGLDRLLLDLLQADKVAYGGFSAGACVMGSTLRGLDLVDDANIAPAGYDADPIWDGLNVLPYAVAPHYKSDHPETESIDKVVQYFADNKIQYRALHDGQAIVINGVQKAIVG